MSPSAPIPRFPGYTVTRKGDVLTAKGIKLTRFQDRVGRRIVNIHTRTYKGSATVARLVGEAFCPDYRPHLRPVYLDGDKGNCAASNLRWVTVSEIMRRKSRSGNHEAEITKRKGGDK